MMRRTRVLHVVQNLNYGGMERVLSDIVSRSDRDRFDMHVLCLQYLGRFSQGLEDVATLHLAQRVSRGSMIWPRALASQIKSIAPDVVHSHSGVWYKATFAARLAHVRRVVHTEHGRAFPDPLINRMVDSIGARRSDVVAAVSAPLAAQLSLRLAVDPKKLRIIPNGVDTALYCPRPDTGRLRSELRIGSDTPIIGSIGRLEPIKGYDVMIQAFLRLRSGGSHRGAVLVIAGEGSERPALERMIQSSGLQDFAFILGWRDDVVDLHSAFTIFTMSSHSEGTSISLLEAMSSGLAPVVTNVGGNAAVLGDVLRQRLVTPGDPAALSAAWEDILTHPDQLERDRRAAVTRVREHFDLEAMVRSYERLYLDGCADSSFPGEAFDRAIGVRGVAPSPRSSAECPPVI